MLASQTFWKYSSATVSTTLRTLVCSKRDCRDIMAATRCAVFVFELNGSRCMNGSSSSPSQRTFHLCWKRSSSAKCGTLSMLTVGLCSGAKGIKLFRDRRKRVHLFTKLILSLFMLGSEQSCGAHLYTLFISWPDACGRSQAPSMVRCANF